jgi:DNA-binding Xre family transcriptional regulator
MEEIVTLEILEKICNVLDCNIGDVVEFVKEND